jgi:nucleoside-diphosphate-sugar epimerase
MKILITGISSALGNAIARGLSEHEVIGLARSKHPCYPTVVCELGAGVPVLPRVDVCLHLACLTDPVLCREHPEEAYRINVRATRQLAEQARRFVLASTGSVYGYQDGVLGEDRQAAPADAYAALKHLAEVEVKSHPNAAVLRYFFPYGPGAKPNSLINRLIRAIDDGREVEVHNGGRPRINPIFLSDAVAATRLFCLEVVPGTWNVAGPEVASIMELAERIGRALGKRPRFRHSGRPIKDMIASTQRLGQMFTPCVDLSTGLHRTVAQWLEETKPGNSREQCA